MDRGLLGLARVGQFGVQMGCGRAGVGNNLADEGGKRGLGEMGVHVEERREYQSDQGGGKASGEGVRSA